MKVFFLPANKTLCRVLGFGHMYRTLHSVLITITSLHQNAKVSVYSKSAYYNIMYHKALT